MILRQIIGFRIPVCRFSELIHRKHNPYLHLSSQQLKAMVDQQLSQKHITASFLNLLILLGSALLRHPPLVTLYINPVLDKSYLILKMIQTQQSEDHYEVEFQNLISMAMKSERKAYQKEFALMYMEIFAHTLPHLHQHLQIYESFKNAPESMVVRQLEDATDFAKTIILDRVHRNIKNISFPEYIHFCRLFLSQVNHEEFAFNVDNYLSMNSGELNQLDQCLLIYEAIELTGSSSLIKHHQMDPSMVAYNVLSTSKPQPKYVCMSMAILKHQQKPYQDILQKLDLTDWPYTYLVWASQFCQQNLIPSILELILKCQIPSTTPLDTIIDFINNANLTAQEHVRIGEWLSSQIKDRKPAQLCSLLQQIYYRDVLAYYRPLTAEILKSSLGNFEWEHYNMVYYFGYIGGLKEAESQTMEYVRRYILNGYAALGVNRRQIPTSSYFYRILAIVDVNEFYASLQ